ncbi:hypothetical protein DPMN_141633 [Dreissena polymorpha]|uniref:Uncharacterized protein n=1 Tax=Dreissena polymorpha TaxID=45954 RepID=A0A9D4G9R1_DREPO|nr:hypothetical protein DPMN_141633 [Dreissena polymorpha]
MITDPAKEIVTMDTLDTEGNNNQDFSTLKRARTTQLAQMTRLYNNLEKNIFNYDNVEKENQLYSKLCSRFEQFKTAHLQILDVCEDSDALDNLEKNYESCKTNFTEFRERYTEWVSGVHPDDNERYSTVSVSSANSVSSQAKRRMAKAKRLVAENKMKMLQQKHEIERARKELELKQQILEQQCKIEEAKLEESMWDQAVAEDLSHTSQILTSGYRLEKRSYTRSTEFNFRVRTTESRENRRRWILYFRRGT